ncbi:putative F-box protein [Arabidopsis thaliana]|uniref:F-box-like domain superfamily n=1 Tax=Arabidopsis thaliana x Arabidopsis arenosa TaxID=1240361 RepID=A0A8T2GN78_9BRAS|nr:F-box-like domain superfamily [Arabidopsis thaliana x Arabidopsis arenosa]
MEQQEKKKRKVYRRRRLQSKPTSSFPLDLASEILLRLPVKSVVRFRCVSKLWSSIITDPYFIKTYETQSSTRQSLLFCFKQSDKLFVFSIPKHHYDSNSSSQAAIDRFQVKLPQEFSYPSPTESVHGLICFHVLATVIVWNPSMRQFLTLPKPRKSWKELTVFLGYDPIEGKHKVVCLPRNRTCDECQVLTLGSAQKSWRTVKTKHKHRSTNDTWGRCIKGVVYYIAYVYHTRVWCIMSFHVKSEKFDMIKLPLENIYRHVMINYEGRLACVDKLYTLNNDGIRLWILEDAEKHKWSSKQFLARYVHNDLRTNTISKLTGVTHAGEFVYISTQYLKSFVLFCDPKKNRFRKVEFNGIVDEEFRLSNGVGRGRIYALYNFPNHCESLMSL